jgi:hypothetical protein
MIPLCEWSCITDLYTQNKGNINTVTCKLLNIVNSNKSENEEWWEEGLKTGSIGTTCHRVWVGDGDKRWLKRTVLCGITEKFQQWGTVGRALREGAAVVKGLILPSQEGVPSLEARTKTKCWA